MEGSSNEHLPGRFPVSCRLPNEVESFADGQVQAAKKTHPRSRASLGGSIPAILVLYSFMCVIVECDGPSLMFAVVIWHVVGFGGTRHPDLRNPPKRLWRRPEFVLEGFPDPQARDQGNLQTRRWGLLEFVLEGSRVPRPGPRKTFQNGLGCALVWRVSRVPRLGAREKPSKTKSEALRHRFGGSGLWKPSKMTSGVPRTRFGGFPGSARPGIRETPENDFGDAPIVLKGCPGPGPGDPGNSPKRLRGRSDIVWKDSRIPRPNIRETVQNDVGGGPQSFWKSFPGPPARDPRNYPKRLRPRTRFEGFPSPPARGPETVPNDLGGAMKMFRRVSRVPR